MKKDLQARRVTLEKTDTLIIIIISIFLTNQLIAFAEESSNYRDELDIRVLSEDVIDIKITPVVEKLSVDTYSLNPNLDFRVYFALNDTGSSIVQIKPQSIGLYNLSVVFETTQDWQYTLGVYTDTPSFYNEYRNASEIYYIEFYTRRVEGISGNSSLILILDSRKRNDGNPPFNFILPQSVNAILFTIVTGVLIYLNAFYMSDTYFKNKKEGISKKRWILILVLAALSLLAIQQIYTFTI